MAAREIGKDRVVAMDDVGWLAVEVLRDADRAVLSANLFAWLGSNRGHTHDLTLVLAGIS